MVLFKIRAEIPPLLFVFRFGLAGSVVWVLSFMSRTLAIACHQLCHTAIGLDLCINSAKK